MTPGEGRRVSEDLRVAARLVHQLPDDDADKAALQRRLIAITASMKQDLPRARDRLEQLLEELRRRQ